MILKDEVGVPSTLGAIFFNLFQMMGIEIVNVVFTWIISILSIIYLVYKIKNERQNYKNKKKL